MMFSRAAVSFFYNVVNQVAGERFPKEQLGGAVCLRHQHQKTVFGNDAACRGLL